MIRHIIRQLSFIILLVLSCDIYAQTKEMESDMFANLKNTDKAAIVAVHFGTTNDAARVLSIERFNTSLQKAFPGIDFREAWTSRIVIRRVLEKEIMKYTPSQVLEQLKLDGFTHILIQPSFIIEGIEMSNLCKEVEKFHKDFKQIRISQPLLVEAEDYAKAVLAVQAVYKDKKSANVLVCHGSNGSCNAQYTMLDYVLRDMNCNNWAVATIEGYPTFDNLTKRLKAAGSKKVNLIPFMFVAGEHVQNDISNEWKKNLESQGFKVKPFTKGLGEIDGIINLFIEHARHTQKYRRYNALERKMQAVARDE